MDNIYNNKSKKKMSQTIVLRKVYALDSNTGLFIEPNNVLVTDGKGGTNWISVISSLTIAGGPIVGDLPSTFSTFYGTDSNSSTLINQLQVGLSTNYPGQITSNNLTSTIDNLGTVGYISSASLTSTIDATATSTLAGLGSAGYISSSSLLSTLENLGSLGYISTPSLVSTVRGLGSIGYVSTNSLYSTVAGLGSIGYLSSLLLESTVQGLGSIGYISTSKLETVIGSTIAGLGTYGYLSTGHLTSTVTGLGSIGYISSLSLRSTVQGLGSIGYVSTQTLLSAIRGVESTITNVRLDRIGNVFMTNCIANFSTVQNVYFLSSIINSTFTITPTPNLNYASVSNTNDLIFSTAQLNLQPFSNYINTSTLVSFDIYPNLYFTRLNWTATNSAVYPISTMLQYNDTILSNTMTTSFLFAGTGKIILEDAFGNDRAIDGSNTFTTPIRLQVPRDTLSNYTNTYGLVHMLPGALVGGLNQNGLNDSNVSSYFDTNRGVSITIQNVPL